jgi:GDSL-like Lipase/Acylhydrolase family
MRPVKMLGFAALATLMAMAFVGAGSAMAESTALCNEDPGTGAYEECPSGHSVTHVHETTLSGAKAKLLSSFINVACDILFLGEAEELGAPQVIEGNFTYTNCDNSCTVTEENAPAEIQVLKEGHEKAKVTYEYQMHLVCGAFINCKYNGESWTGTAKGPLLSAETKGSVSIQEQVAHKVGGVLCPKEVKLDITTTPLIATYIAGGEEGLSATPTSLSTELSGGGKKGTEITVSAGTKVKDAATLSGENASIATGTVKYKVYSDSKCEKLVTNAGEVTVKEGKVPDSEEKELEAGKEYFWLAEYGGDSLNEPSKSTCSKEVLKVKASTTLSTELSGGGEKSVVITVAEGTKVKDTATLSGTNASTATGKVEYAVYKDKECKELATKAGEGEVKEGKAAASEEKELEAGAVYYWLAEYGGDSSHEPSTSICGKEVLTVKAKTSLSTELSGGGKKGTAITVAEGTKVKDTATLSGTNASKAGGTVTYKVYSDSKCEKPVTKADEVTVKDGKAPDSKEEELQAGAAYYWQAEYLGDSLHGKSISICSKEILTVKANTSLSTELSGGGKKGTEITVSAGTKVKDAATLSGENASIATGKVDYAVYSDSKCENLVTNVGEGKVDGTKVADSEEKDLEAGKEYFWRAEYLGDSLHEASTSICSKEVLKVKANTSLTTKLSGDGKVGAEITVAEGTKVKDTATLSGTNASTATGKVKYAVYEDNACTMLVTKAGEGDVKVPDSEEVLLKAGAVYYWLAEYEGDSLHEASTSICSKEVLKVKANTSLSTQLSGGDKKDAVISVAEGTKVKDTATLSGTNASTATGIVKYAVYEDNKCTVLATKAGEGEVKDGKVPDSEEVLLKAGAVYYWLAEYEGDTLHEKSTSTCGKEVETVRFNTSISTKLSGGGKAGTEITVAEGSKVMDTAILLGTNASTAAGVVDYAVYEDNACKELVTKASAVAVNDGKVPDSDEVWLKAGAVYYWLAEYLGDSLHEKSISACSKEVVTVKANTSLSTELSGGIKKDAIISVAEGTKVKDTATLSGTSASSATGIVKYAVYEDSACTELVTKAGEVTVKDGSIPDSNEVELKAGVVYYWLAEYEGDTLHEKSTSTCGKEVETVKFNTSISTELSGGGQKGAEITVAENSIVKDTATLSGTNAPSATGIVKYAVYSDSKCENLVTNVGEGKVDGTKVADSGGWNLKAGKEYFWQAKYEGDSLHEKEISICSKEVLTVKANTSLSTQLSGGGVSGVSITVVEGSKVMDTAILSGTNASTATGKVKYAVYGDNACTELVIKAGEGEVKDGNVPDSEEVMLKAGAVYYWLVEYEGDTLHEKSTSICSQAEEWVKFKTSLTTKLSGGDKEGAEITVAEGSIVKDTATLSGVSASTAIGKVKYAVYEDNACTELVIKAGEGEVKDGNVPDSDEVELKAGAVYYWVAEYEGDYLHEKSTSACDKEVETVKANTSLSTELSGGGKKGAEITVAEGTKVKDTATLSGTNASTATGKVKYAVYGDNACTELVIKAGEGDVKAGNVPDSEEVMLKAGAVYYWLVEYEGDTLHEKSTSTCDKEVLTVKANTSLSTGLSDGDISNAIIFVTEGTKVKDTAILSGTSASTATGTVKYKVYEDEGCKKLATKAGEVTVKDGEVPDSEEKELKAGAVYYWQAEYGGDTLHEESTSTCDKEVETVQFTTWLSTTLSGGDKEGAEITVAEGTKVMDTATLSGTNASSATGWIDYAVYKDKECKEFATEAGEGKVEGTEVASSEEKKLEAGREYFWQAEYSGDLFHEPSTSTCSKEVLTVKANTSLSTLLLSGAEVGEEPAIGEEITVAEGLMVADTAILSGTNASTATGTATYSVYADNACKELVANVGEVEVEGGSIPDSSDEELEKGVYYWQVSYSGDSLHEGSTSPCDEVATVLASTSLATSLVGKGEEGEEGELTTVEGVPVSDTATLSGEFASKATGSVEYSVYSDFECKELVEEAGKVTVKGTSVPASSELTLEPGIYYWQAVYSGDGTNHGSKSQCGSEIVAVSPPLTTTLSGEGISGADIQVLEGAGVTDEATLHVANASKATGTVEYQVYSDEGCKKLVAIAGKVSVTGGSVPPSSEEKLEAGTYYWRAAYSGDGEHAATTSLCGSEVLDVVTETSISTLLIHEKEKGSELEVEEGSAFAVSDQATLSGANALSAEGYVEFSVYADSECTELVEVAGDADVSEGTASSDYVALPAGTYYWQAVYSGDSLNQSSTSPCGVEVEVVQAPITTSLAGGEQEGEEIEVPGETAADDTATLHGPGAAKATGWVEYFVYSDFRCTQPAAYAGKVTVKGASVPSSTYETLAEGVYYWQAKYSGDKNIPPATSRCRETVLRVANPPRTYAALGDSFSAGVGIGEGAGLFASYYENTHATAHAHVNICYRNENSWPALVAEKVYDDTVVQEANVFKRLPEKFIFRACSGAKMEHLWKTPPDPSAGQWEEAVLPGDTWFDKPTQALWLTWPGGTLTDPLVPNYAINLVTVTIGGNDVGFANVARQCIKGLPRPRNDPYTLLKCLEKIHEEEVSGLPLIAEKLPVALERIQASAPFAKIRVPLYPELVHWALGQDIPVMGRNYGPGYTIDGVEVVATEPPAPAGMRNMSAARAIGRLEANLNRTVSEVVKTAAVLGVPVELIGNTATAFAGHELGDAEPWVNGVFANLMFEESLHPNSCGYRALARGVLSVVAPDKELPDTC